MVHCISCLSKIWKFPSSETHLSVRAPNPLQMVSSFSFTKSVTLDFFLYISIILHLFNLTRFFFYFWRKNVTPSFSRSIPTWARDHTPPNLLESDSITHLLICILTSSSPLFLFPSQTFIAFFPTLKNMQAIHSHSHILSPSPSPSSLFLKTFKKASGLSSVFIHSTTHPIKEPLLSTYYALNTCNEYKIITQVPHTVGWGGVRGIAEETKL